MNPPGTGLAARVELAAVGVRCTVPRGKPRPGRQQQQGGAACRSAAAGSVAGEVREAARRGPAEKFDIQVPGHVRSGRRIITAIAIDWIRRQEGHAVARVDPDQPVAGRIWIVAAIGVVVELEVPLRVCRAVLWPAQSLRRCKGLSLRVSYCSSPLVLLLIILVEKTAATGPGIKPAPTGRQRVAQLSPDGPELCWARIRTARGGQRRRSAGGRLPTPLRTIHESFSFLHSAARGALSALFVNLRRRR